jgi:hypothetical protein
MYPGKDRLCSEPQMDDIWLSVKASPSVHIKDGSDSQWETKTITMDDKQERRITDLMRLTQDTYHPNVEQGYEIHCGLGLLSPVPYISLLHSKSSLFIRLAPVVFIYLGSLSLSHPKAFCALSQEPI